MSKARDLADLIAAGNPLADGTVEVADISDLTATAAELNYNDITTIGDVEINKVVTANSSGNVNWPDNRKAQFGNGDDLQIYHDGTHSYITDYGTGNLYLRGTSAISLGNPAGTSTMATFIDGGEVRLTYNNSVKIRTNTSGIEVVGTADVDTLSIGGTAVTATPTELNILDGVTATAAELNYNDITTLGTSQASKVLTADANGDVVVSEEFRAKSYNETYVSLTAAATVDVNCETGNYFALSTGQNTTFTFSNPPASGTGFVFILEITQGGAYTLTWPAAVAWAGGAAPDAPGSGEVAVYAFATRNGGTTWYGFQAGTALA